MGILRQLPIAMVVCASVLPIHAEPLPDWTPPPGMPPEMQPQSIPLFSGTVQQPSGVEQSAGVPMQMQIQELYSSGSESSSTPIQFNKELADPKNWSQLHGVPPSTATATTTYENPSKFQGQVTGFQQDTNPNPGVATHKPSALEQIRAFAASGIRGVAQKFNVGGISLSKAAAERMALNIDIEAVTYRDGQIVITGTDDNATKLDAALFLTSLRLACGVDDPYFSLDPVDGAAWLEQSRAALDIAWKRLQDRIKGRLRDSRFDVQTFSVRRDFPSLWAEISPRYPELRTQLVFHPEWLRQTRFGDILYKADVLLKELSVGAPVLAADKSLRAEQVPGYIAPDKRLAARGLLIPNDPQQKGWQGHRLWFDLMPQAGPGALPAYEDPDANIDRRSNRALYRTLKTRGYVDAPKPRPLQTSAVYVNAGIADISAVYPKMFIRRHDSATGQDLDGASPDLDLLSADVNHRTALYAGAYQELRDLTDIFRAYIASTKIVNANREVCANVPRELTGGEKLAKELDQFRPSELFITIAKGSAGSSSLKSVNGGIALRGKQYLPQAVVEKKTDLIEKVERDLGAGVPAPRFTAESGLQYLAFDTREPPRRVPIVATGTDP